MAAGVAAEPPPALRLVSLSWMFQALTVCYLSPSSWQCLAGYQLGADYTL